MPACWGNVRRFAAQAAVACSAATVCTIFTSMSRTSCLRDNDPPPPLPPHCCTYPPHFLFSVAFVHLPVLKKAKKYKTVRYSIW